jgi:hypothetical protein
LKGLIMSPSRTLPGARGRCEKFFREVFRSAAAPGLCYLSELVNGHCFWAAMV